MQKLKNKKITVYIVNRACIMISSKEENDY